MPLTVEQIEQLRKLLGVRRDEKDLPLFHFVVRNKVHSVHCGGGLGDAAKKLSNTLDLRKGTLIFSLTKAGRPRAWKVGVSPTIILGVKG